MFIGQVASTYRLNAILASPLAGGTVSVGLVLTKLGLPVSDTEHRRVLGVLAYLRSP